MKKFTYLDIAALVIWLLPVGYLAFIYESLPATVPLHYGINGDVDRYGAKSELIMAAGIMLFAGALVYLLMKFLPAIDPKRQVKIGESTFQKLGMGVVLFLSALNIGILYTTAHHGITVDKIILPIAGLLFAFLGNVMHSIKPNYFAGVRTPWTLEDEDTWRVTHRLAGKLWFTGGIVITIATLLLPSGAATIVFMCSLTVLALVPVVYSYIYFKNHQLKS